MGTSSMAVEVKLLNIWKWVLKKQNPIQYIQMTCILDRMTVDVRQAYAFDGSDLIRIAISFEILTQDSLTNWTCSGYIDSLLFRLNRGKFSLH